MIQQCAAASSSVPHAIRKTRLEMNIICLCLLLFATSLEVTSFGISHSMVARTTTRSHVGSMEMKGKGGRVPIDQRGEFLKQQRMMEARDQMLSKQNRDSGVPVFKVFVRPRAGGLWIPCGDLQGDNRATALVNAWMSGFMTDMYKGQLDQGIARSIFSQEDTFVTGLIENYKPFRKFTKEDLQFGYKIDFPGLEEKMGEQKVIPLEKGMEKGWIDNVKEGFGNIFGNKG